MVFVTCCCASQSGNCPSDGVQVVDGPAAVDHTEDDQHKAKRMQHSATGSFFPAPLTTPRQVKGGDNQFAASVLEKEQEKVRLQTIVTDFKRVAITGLRVELIEPESLSTSQHIFSLDKLLYKMTLRPVEEDSEAGASSSQVFDMQRFVHICKGPDVVPKAPSLQAHSERCMCVGFAPNSEGAPVQQLFFYFTNESERDKFYTCLKILQMSSTILRREMQR